MQTSGIKIDIDKSDKLLIDNSKEIEIIIKFAVRQATEQRKKNTPTETPKLKQVEIKKE